mmetsp:Transcript_9994/g.28269  ORF Transcript_9994/g.28269 Transcript_9994/m.28269 type:complete len:142 (-) Transcript_9994:68-493(-)
MCKCGYHQTEHQAKGANKAAEALNRLKAGSKANLSNDHTPINGGACGNFAVDPAAKEFGTCYCGFKKGDHVEREEDPAAAMLRRLKEKNAKANERADQLAAGVNVGDNKKEDASAGKKASGAAKTKAKKEKAASKSCCVVM